MKVKKHLTFDDRICIQQGLSEKKSFKAIAADISKDCTTVSKEIRNHLVFKKTGAPARSFNDCRNRRHCSHYGDVCPFCDKNGRRNKCSLCRNGCGDLCADYVKDECALLTRPPYVCNGCSNRHHCTLEKRLYIAKDAQKEYEAILSESRSGFNLTEAERLQLDAVISPLLRNGQSLHHILVHNRDSINCCEKTAYLYASAGLFEARNIDMPRKVRFRVRKKKSVELKVDKSCRIGRTFDFFLRFRKEHPSLPVVELDSVEGKKGHAVLLTIHFVLPKLQLAYRREANDSASVTAVFDELYESLGPVLYKKLFPILLCDNGTEFSNPRALEFDRDGNRRSYVFYCDPAAPGQKGACENNHEMIRRIIPKGVDITPYSQTQILTMMDHINSYGRPDLGDRSPYELFEFYYGREPLEKFGIRLIPSNDILLRPALLNHADTQAVNNK